MDYRIKCLMCNTVDYFPNPMTGWLCPDCRLTGNEMVPLSIDTEEGFSARLLRLEEKSKEPNVALGKMQEWFNNRFAQLEHRIQMLEDNTNSLFAFVDRDEK